MLATAAALAADSCTPQRLTVALLAAAASRSSGPSVTSNRSSLGWSGTWLLRSRPNERATQMISHQNKQKVYTRCAARLSVAIRELSTLLLVLLLVFCSSVATCMPDGIVEPNSHHRTTCAAESSECGAITVTAMRPPHRRTGPACCVQNCSALPRLVLRCTAAMSCEKDVRGAGCDGRSNTCVPSDKRSIGAP